MNYGTIMLGTTVAAGIYGTIMLGTTVAAGIFGLTMALTAIGYRHNARNWERTSEYWRKQAGKAELSAALLVKRLPAHLRTDQEQAAVIAGRKAWSADMHAKRRAKQRAGKAAA